MIDAFEGPVSKEGLEAMSRKLHKQMEIGLEKENHDGEVKMLITYVHDLPDGKENGEFLAMDLGLSIMIVSSIIILLLLIKVELILEC